MVVYVINGNKKPLMPCTPRKARLLLKNNRAKVVNMFPFTIRLNYVSFYEKKQDLILGLDAGFENVGVSVVENRTKDELFAAEGKIRTDVSKRLLERKMYRISRRSRKTRYRKPRFLNRGSSLKKDLMPSVQHKLDSHIRIINTVNKFLPVSRVVFEKAKFDIQKIQNYDISGVEYQQGPQKNFYNVKEYVLCRDNYTCQHCKGKKKDKVLVVHHIRGKAEGSATDRPEELLVVCKTCHDDHHKGADTIPVPEKFKTFRAETVMNTVCSRLSKLYDCTYGYVTKYHRKEYGIEKSHVNDAYIIAGGNDFGKRSAPVQFKMFRSNNRGLHKTFVKGGGRPSSSLPKKIFNFQLYDLVKTINNVIGYISGRRTSGCFAVRTAGNNLLQHSYRKLSLIQRSKNIRFIPACAGNIN